MNLDLNMDNYSFDDVLNLFGFSKRTPITNKDLKQAYRKTLSTHPDKSGLPKDYFLFFSKAYKMIYSVFYVDEEKKKQEECAKKKVYQSWEHKEVDNAVIQETLEQDNFQEWFNTMFDKLHIVDEEKDEGYGEWLKEETDHTSIHSVQEMHEHIKQKQKECREITPFKTLSSVDGNQTSSNILRDEVKEYSSGLFSSLGYEDLKKAHTETVVPVTEEDYEQRQKFKSVFDLQSFRAKDNTTNYGDHDALYKAHKEEEEMQDRERQFKMMKQKEESEKVQNQWWRIVKTITNS